MPRQDYPEHMDRRLRAEHRIPAGERLWVQVPATDRHLRVFSMVTDPAATAERYDEAGRWLRTPTGPVVFRVTTHLRDFGRDGRGANGFRAPDELFPDAHRIHALRP